MNGKIGVDSTFGKGSTFWFEIKLPLDQEAKPQKSIVPVDVDGSKILIVDDNAVNRSILNEMLGAAGFDCAAVSSGKEAFSILKAVANHGLKTDCIVLDYQMPSMSGGDFIKIIRQDSALAEIPIILLTSVEQTTDGKAFSSLGIEGYLTKPARSSMLLNMLVNALQEKSQAEKSNTERQANIQAVRQLVNKAEEPEQETPQPEDRNIDILLCEDNEINQLVFRQLLDDMGMAYVVANDGEEGVELFKKHNPSMVIMDVSMPKKSGLDATREIRELEQDRDTNVAIIGVTAHALKGDMERCLDAGMDDYLSKPVSPDALSQKIANWSTIQPDRASA